MQLVYGLNCIDIAIVFQDLIWTGKINIYELSWKLAVKISVKVVKLLILRVFSSNVDGFSLTDPPQMLKRLWKVQSIAHNLSISLMNGYDS